METEVTVPCPRNVPRYTRVIIHRDNLESLVWPSINNNRRSGFCFLNEKPIPNNWEEKNQCPSRWWKVLVDIIMTKLIWPVLRDVNHIHLRILGMWLIPVSWPDVTSNYPTIEPLTPCITTLGLQIVTVTICQDCQAMLSALHRQDKSGHHSRHSFPSCARNALFTLLTPKLVQLSNFKQTKNNLTI